MVRQKLRRFSLSGGHEVLPENDGLIGIKTRASHEVEADEIRLAFRQAAASRRRIGTPARGSATSVPSASSLRSVLRDRIATPSPASTDALIVSICEISAATRSASGASPAARRCSSATRRVPEPGSRTITGSAANSASGTSLSAAKRCPGGAATTSSSSSTGVTVIPGSKFFARTDVSHPRNHLRLAFSHASHDEIDEGVRRLAAAYGAVTNAPTVMLDAVS